MTAGLHLLAGRLRALAVFAIFALDPASVAALAAVAVPVANLFWKA